MSSETLLSEALQRLRRVTFPTTCCLTQRQLRSSKETAMAYVVYLDELQQVQYEWLPLAKPLKWAMDSTPASFAICRGDGIVPTTCAAL